MFTEKEGDVSLFFNMENTFRPEQFSQWFDIVLTN
jgi:hypothetical protein